MSPMLCLWTLDVHRGPSIGALQSQAFPDRQFNRAVVLQVTHQTGKCWAGLRKMYSTKVSKGLWEPLLQAWPGQTETLQAF